MLLVSLIFALSAIACVTAWQYTNKLLHNLKISGEKIIPVSVIASSLLFGSTAAIGNDKLDGRKIFDSSCAACHAGGGNILPFAKDKTLFKDALAKNGYNNKESIARIVSEGKGLMLPYGPIGDKLPASLNPEQIDAVSNYVLQQANAGWK